MHASIQEKNEAVPADLQARTIDGLHEGLISVLRRHLPASGRVADLGAGTGAWAARLKALGHQVVAVERDADSYRFSGAELVVADLNEPFAAKLSGRFAALTSVEVIEHLENPRAFLRECHKLLEPGGFLFLTTPNIENVPARLQYLATGSLRMFGKDPRFNDPTHITPIHTHMFERMVRDTGFVQVEHTFNRREPSVTRLPNRLLTRLVGPLLRGLKGGDCHIFVLRRS
ncbi:class I SAM-dependent methyltransferase [Archangium lansingense]|uniref:Class I SAM-dependent methyltransferase n=1 Tax=Archangium lansingense TaxID=2995310 RepID=A0ABT4A165_9BACT|nr:class I SAM-dependent methyltransferase [Archangium lansinium]MCY1075373.1 class I SAM-dependent methyltransferase [Archangium lansinium]